LTTFFNFLAAHWTSLRTTNPIESSFSTVKLGTTKPKRGAGSPKAKTVMAFKLLQGCEKKWCKIEGWKYSVNILLGVEYKDGVMISGQIENQEAEAI
jgi:putative transposase